MMPRFITLYVRTTHDKIEHIPQDDINYFDSNIVANQGHQWCINDGFVFFQNKTYCDVVYFKGWGWIMVFSVTFNNISVISWRSVLLIEETGVPGENHRPVASHW